MPIKLFLPISLFLPIGIFLPNNLFLPISLFLPIHLFLPISLFWHISLFCLLTFFCLLSEGIKSMETDLKKFWHASSSETEEEVAHLQKSFFDRRPRTYYQDTDPVPVLQTI